MLGLAIVAGGRTARAADETRDYGFQLSAGGLTGIGQSVHWQIGAESDFYFLSEQIRMSFGVHFILPQGQDIPVTAVEFVGIEGYIPLGPGEAFGGVRYFKPYLQESKNGFTGVKGWIYQAGYKWPVSVSTSGTLTFGLMDIPLTQSPADPALPLSPSFFMRTGYEWYF